MTGRRWISMVAFLCFERVAFVAPARAGTADAAAASKDAANTKKSDNDKKAARPKAKKRRQPIKEGDQDEYGIVYGK